VATNPVIVLISSDHVSHSYNNRVAVSVNPRLDNLLASLSLNLAEEANAALEDASGLAGSAALALLALEEFLDDAHVGRLAEVLGLTHSGAVRLVTLLEAEGFAERRPGADRRRVEVRLTPAGRRTAAAARGARDAVVRETTSGLSAAESARLEVLLSRLVEARVAARVVRRRAEGDSPAWWCRTCDFSACGRPEGRCPAQVTAQRLLDP
jgi:MarR family transcriptional repressor of emrRAB